MVKLGSMVCVSRIYGHDYSIIIQSVLTHTSHTHNLKPIIFGSTEIIILHQKLFLITHKP